MCDGIVIDAHMIPAIRDELVRHSGSLYELICWVIENCGIARTPQIENHWRSKFSANRDHVFWKWYMNQVLNKAIHNIPPKNLSSSVKKKIRDDYGLSDPTVMEYIKCAYATNEPRYILAEDMYFYDPRERRAASATQIEIKESRQGRLCKYLEEQLHIRVGTPADCKSHFSIDQSPCSDKNEVRIDQRQCSKLP